LISAAPGVGKSAFVLNYVIKSGTPTLYFSADSDAFTQLSRIVSMLTGTGLDQAAELVRSGETESYREALTGLPSRFIFEASPDLEDIKQSLKSYEELYGEYPELIVIDNITDVRTGNLDNDANPTEGMEFLCSELHSLARTYQTAVIGLHHVTGPHNSGDKPVSLSGLKGQIGRVPEMVLTLHKVDAGNGDFHYLRASAVKNRGGKSDSSGETFAELEFEGAKMNITDVRSHFSFGV